MKLYLDGKAAIVTGASQGIGRAIVKELAMEGVSVLATARNEILLNDLVKEVVALGGIKPVPYVQNFLFSEAPKNIAAAALSCFDRVDILVNNVGHSQPLDVVDLEEKWAESMTLEFERPRQLTQELLPVFLRQKEGVILNVVSTYELRSVNASAVAKAAIAAWSKQLAGQLGQHGIRINCLQPGLIDTENIRRFFSAEERKKFAEREIPLGDFGNPEDMAAMAAFLVSPRARYITGSIAVIDGGMRHSAF